MQSDIIIFSDGSSRGNPGPGGWGSVIVDRSNNTVRELGGSEMATTNNRMEIIAALRALETLLSSGRTHQTTHTSTTPIAVTVYTDSSYLINGATKWVYGWQKNGWMTKEKKEVLNKDLWEALVRVLSAFKSLGTLSWVRVGGHVGVAGNERCDEIATMYADNSQSGSHKLYNGPLATYSVPHILDISADMLKVSKKSSSANRSRTQAYSYVSMVDGKVMTHSSWVECEARVRGVRGALFKKALSPEDEEKIRKIFIKN